MLRMFCQNICISYIFMIEVSVCYLIMFYVLRVWDIEAKTYILDCFIGEANVYTLGDIGKHRVVSTKLPMAGGQSRDALIATGGTTTRLLGTFQVRWLITYCVHYFDRKFISGYSFYIVIGYHFEYVGCWTSVSRRRWRSGPTLHRFWKACKVRRCCNVCTTIKRPKVLILLK